MKISHRHLEKAKQEEAKARYSLKILAKADKKDSSEERFRQTMLTSFQLAIRYYILAEKWEEASKLYIQLSTLKNQESQKLIYYSQVLKLAELYRHKTIIPSLETIIDSYIEKGKYQEAAKTQQIIAEIYEIDQQFLSAQQAYEDTAKIYQFEMKEGNEVKSMQCLLKAVDAGICDEYPDYERLIKIIKTLHQNDADVKLKTPIYLCLKNVLLHIAILDHQGAKNARYMTTRFETDQLMICESLVENLHWLENFIKFYNQIDDISCLRRWKMVIYDQIIKRNFTQFQGNALKKVINTQSKAKKQNRKMMEVLPIPYVKKLKMIQEQKALIIAERSNDEKIEEQSTPKAKKIIQNLPKRKMKEVLPIPYVKKLKLIQQAIYEKRFNSQKEITEKQEEKPKDSPIVEEMEDQSIEDEILLQTKDKDSSKMLRTDKIFNSEEYYDKIQSDKSEILLQSQQIQEDQ